MSGYWLIFVVIAVVLCAAVPFAARWEARADEQDADSWTDEDLEIDWDAATAAFLAETVGLPTPERGAA